MKTLKTIPIMACVILTFCLSIASAEVVEIDSNFDGKIDQWQYFNSSGILEKAEYDTNHDGKADRWEYFDATGKLTRIEIDRNFDGKPDVVQNK